MKQWKQFLWVFVLTISMVLTPFAANAYTVLQCDASGNAVAGTTLFNTDNAGASSECQYSGLPVIEHIFSYVICDFVRILNQIMDSMYCGMNYYMVKIMAALMTLYLTIYGAQILMGTAQLSTRDALVRMLKLSFIYVLSTNAAEGISVIFAFFMGVVSTTTTAVLSALSVSAQNDGTCSFSGTAAGDVMTLYSFFDYLVCHALIGPISQASTRVQGLMLAMVFALPPMTLLFQWWFITTIKTLVITLVTFLKCLAAIAFLVALAPFFLGFFLFQSTAYVFENWLRYLISYSVQVCLVLAIVVLWVMTIYNFVDFFNVLGGTQVMGAWEPGLVFPLKPVRVMGGVYEPSDGFAVCPPWYDTDPVTGEPSAECDVTTTYATNPDYNGNTPPGKCIDKPSSPRLFNADPPVCTGDAPAITCQPPVNPNWQCDQKDLLPPATIINQGEFLWFVFYNLFTLLLITYCFSIMLEKADSLARALAGPQSVPSLKPGFGNSLGNVNSFKAPASAGGGATKKFAQDFHNMLSRS